MSLTRGKPPGSIIRRLTYNLALTIGLLLGALAASILAGSFIVSNQKDLDEQKSQILQDIDIMLTSMVEQETGVRGYINTTDQIFLEPYTRGRTQYLATVQSLEVRTHQAEMDRTIASLRQAEDRADRWYQQVTQAQVSQVSRGGTDLQLTRSPEVARQDKLLFDSFRQSLDTLRGQAQDDLGRIQGRADLTHLFVLAVTLVIASIAVLFIWFSFNHFIAGLRRQMDRLMDVTIRLAKGDLSVRVHQPSQDEMGQLGQNFNSMAQALERQQYFLKQRDIQDSILELNNSLNTSLELEPLLDNFLVQLLTLLNLEVGAIYLYKTNTGLLTIGAVQGFDRAKLQPIFTLGEGMVGRAAQTRQVLLFNQPESVETAGFEVKTILGQVLPANLLHLPIERGGELLGVLVVGNVQPLTENTRNVLNVIGGNLAVSISNALAYRHIQSQAIELEARRKELEANNTALSEQRDELTVLNTALEEANRLRNQFLSTMSHELRTPLTAIIGFSQLMLRGRETENFSPKQKINLERILKNGQHLLSLVNDVLDIAKIEAGRMDITRSDIQIEPFIVSLVEQMQSLATQKGLSMRCEVAENIGQLETDPEKLRQILVNLLSNSIKFTETGSVSVKIEALNISTSPADNQPEQIQISVKDTGIGIPYEKQDHIFEEFYQIDSSSTRKYGGTGLGLSIVLKLTDLLGGTLGLSSQTGEGSTFTVTLPRYMPNRAIKSSPSKPVAGLSRPIAPATSPALSAHSGVSLKEFSAAKRLVVAVDDEPDIIELIQASLENTDYSVTGLQDASSALPQIKYLQPYAVILDVMMPGMTGWQVLQHLKADPATARIPVIMLSVVSDRGNGFAQGASDYLIKPIEREVLIETLDRLTNSSGRANLILNHNPNPPADRAS